MSDAIAAIRDKIGASFARQGLMKTLGGRLGDVDRGVVSIELPFSEGVTQQHGYFHAAAVTAIADNAGGYAALTLLDPHEEVLAVEFKINFLTPAIGERLVAEGKALRAGRTLVISQISVNAVAPGGVTLVAIMQQTNIRVAAQR